MIDTSSEKIRAVTFNAFVPTIKPMENSEVLIKSRLKKQPFKITHPVRVIDPHRTIKLIVIMYCWHEEPKKGLGKERI